MAVQTVAQPKKSTADQILLAVEAEECRRSLKTFKRAVWHIIEPVPYVDGWCQDALDEHLEAVTKGYIRKIVITIPPRHTKSTELVIWRAWLWTQDADARILAASYSLALSIRDNVRVRRILEDPWFQDRYGKEFQMVGDQNVKSHFENTKRGYQMALSVDGGTTGQGGSYLVLDDPHNASEAHSEVEREAATTWFREVWTNRLNDQEKDKMVVVGQRIHEVDVCGYILNERPDWTHLNLPAEYEPARHCTTALGWSDPRQVEGELLWPQRFSQETLDGLKRDLGPNGYAAQYQQSPVPATGGTFQHKHERTFSLTHDSYILHTPRGDRAVNKADCELFISVDPAISEKEGADFMVIQTWIQTPIKDLLLLDVKRGHWSHHDQQEEVEEAYDAYPGTVFAAVETVAYQNALFQDLISKGIFCKPFTPHRDKVARAAAAAIWHQNGKIYFLRGADWLPELQKELYKFPNASHDDQVDALSLASIVVRSRGPLSDEITYDEIPDPVEGPPEAENVTQAPTIGETLEELQRDPFAYVDQLQEVEGWQ